MRGINCLRPLAAVSITSSILFGVMIQTMFLFADSPPLQDCNGKILSELYDCLPLDMAGCAFRTQAQCPAISCGGGDGMKPYYQVVNQMGSCINNNNLDGWQSGKGWTTGCAARNEPLVCYYEYACTWNKLKMECVPFEDVCCTAITVDSYNANYECQVSPGGSLAEMSPPTIHGPAFPGAIVATATRDPDQQFVDSSVVSIPSR